MHKVSVIIAAWNAEQTIVASVKSALSQTYPPFEVLVCDDGSSDKTVEKAAQVKDKRVRFLRLNHTGFPAATRNCGLAIASGEWIAFLDGDDQWEKRKLEMQFRLLRGSVYKASCTNAYKLMESNKRELFHKMKKSRFTFSDLLTGNYIICSSTLVHRSVLTYVGGFPMVKGMEDYALWLLVATQTAFLYLKEPLVLYRHDPKRNKRNFLLHDSFAHRQLALRYFLIWSIKYRRFDKYLWNAFISFFRYQKSMLSRPRSLFHNF